MSSHVCWVNWLRVTGGSMCVNWLVFYICGTKRETDPDRCDPSCGDLSVWPLDAGLHHVAGHQLESLLQMFGELGLRPVEVQHEHLQSVQLPEEILRGGRAVTAGRRDTTEYHKHNMNLFLFHRTTGVWGSRLFFNMAALILLTMWYIFKKNSENTLTPAARRLTSLPLLEMSTFSSLITFNVLLCVISYLNFKVNISVCFLETHFFMNS